MSIEIAFSLLCALVAAALSFLAAWNWEGGRYLCDNCRFNNPDSCHKPERPSAVICKAYRKIEHPN